MRPVVIRPLRRGDERGVRRVVEAVLREHGLWRSHIPYMGDLEDPRRSYARPGGFLVAVSGGRIVGCGGISPRGSRGSLQRMYLLKPWRGLGLGRRILEKLLASSRRRGLEALTLETAPRLKAAIALYRGYGFKRVKSQAGDCCSVKMRLRLAAYSSGHL